LALGQFLEDRPTTGGWVDGVAISFGPFTLFPNQRRLERSGVPVRLGSRTLEVLLVLIERAPGLVSKGELIGRVWPGLVVEDINLRLQIGLLRKALGDPPASARYISTVQGRGYCFVANVSRTLRESAAAGRAAPATDAPKTNLPLPMHAIVGRERELGEVEHALRRHRLVSVVGAGGVGKTRLAVELGRRVLPRYPDGVWVIDLAPLSDPALIASAAAAVLNLSGGATDLTAEAIARRIARRELLLIFDNCEHLVEPVAKLVRQLVSYVDGLTVLATSQESLRVAEEQIYALEPLALAPVGETDIAAYGAVSLFVERARGAERRFSLSPENAGAVGEVCRRLDGIPLALEMAAARLPVLGIEGLRAGLPERFSLLQQDSGRSGGRHPTLRHLAAWSYGLLDEIDQNVFRRLSVFPGSFALDDAVALMAHVGIDQWGTLDALWRLREKSLIAVEHTAAPRYRLLETLRLYALEALGETGENDAVAAQHAARFTDVFGRAESAWETMPDLSWMALYRPEIDNLRAALEWALAEPARNLIALSLAVPGLHLLFALSLTAEGRRYVERLTPLIDQDTPPALEAGFFLRASTFYQNSRSQRGVEYIERAVSLYRGLRGRPRLVWALSVLGSFQTQGGLHEQAQATLDEAERLASPREIEGAGPRQLERARHRVTTALGLLATDRKRFTEARAYFVRAVQMARDLRSTSEATCLSNLSYLEYSLGNVETAIERSREAIECARATAGNRGLGLALMNTAAYLLALDRPIEARPVAEEALVRLGETDFPVVICLQIWAVLVAFEGRLKEAAQLIGFVDAERLRRTQPRTPAEQRLYDELTQRLVLGAAASDVLAWRTEGARWEERAALDFTFVRLMSRAAPSTRERSD